MTNRTPALAKAACISEVGQGRALVPLVSYSDSSGPRGGVWLVLGVVGFLNALFKLLRTYHLGLGPGFRVTETSALEASLTNVRRALNIAHGT